MSEQWLKPAEVQVGDHVKYDPWMNEGVVLAVHPERGTFELYVCPVQMTLPIGGLDAALVRRDGKWIRFVE
jgi:hypothetical protein